MDGVQRTVLAPPYERLEDPRSSLRLSAGAARSARKVTSPAGTCSSPVILVAYSWSPS